MKFKWNLIYPNLEVIFVQEKILGFFIYVEYWKIYLDIKNVVFMSRICIQVFVLWKYRTTSITNKHLFFAFFTLSF